ncbi:MAG: hypothetical protein H9897_01065 [Candidatus Ureaplasma intestinipullorum]|uniref:Pantothenate kinase n=1 Tax=Candidatus Ureaplasma intestinipullorum TaxID=2838770 RepID=A0A9E2KV44_9BACT|nr:hypothetical protein [Candidatus Ureaplasma intestinipullorum]
MKIYVDIGNTNIKYLCKDKFDDIKIIKSDIENFKNLLNSYKNFDFVVIITHKEKKIYIDILRKSKVNFKIVTNKDFENNINPNIDINEIGVDILLASKYFKSSSGLIILNGTALVSIYIDNGIIQLVTLGAGTSYQNELLNRILNLNDKYNFEITNGTNTFDSICLNNYINIFGIINYFSKKKDNLKIVLSGNNFLNQNLNDILKISNNIEVIENLVLKMLEKSF